MEDPLLTLTRPHLEIAGAVFAVILAIIGVRSWIGEHDARLKAEVTVTADQKISDAAISNSKAQEVAMAARDKAAADREQAMVDAIKNLKTTPQILPYVQSNLAPGSATPIIVQVPAATKDDPTPPATITIAQSDLPVLRDRLSKCDTDALKVSTCAADIATKTQQLHDAGVSLSEVEGERDAYKQELAGGTKWQRTKKALKFIGIGALAGAAAVCGSGHCK
jgi:hypothetical protein